MKMQKLFAVALGLSLSLTACAGDDATAPPSGAAEPSAAAAPAATGNVVEVKMITDGVGNRFEPAELTVKQGDVVRFVLVSGVHNVSFPSASNAGASGLPGPSPFLQLPGQAYDLTVTMGPGTYSFVCDPHAALGMKGTLTVE